MNSVSFENLFKRIVLSISRTQGQIRTSDYSLLARAIDKESSTRTHLPGSLKWPFLGVSLFMVGLELATSIARALSLGPLVTLTPIIGACYAVILLSATLLFFIVGSRTLRQLKAGEKIVTTQTAAAKRILSKTTKLIMVSGIFSIIWIIGTLFTVIRPVRLRDPF